MKTTSKVQTLLINNYDSFTYNLYQLISEVNGIPPIVVPNNTDWDKIPFDIFDNIVISPGPGRPERLEDFGISGKALLESKLPILGVCLGHQGIAHFFGGKVAHAPEPVHGRLTQVSHLNIDIFKGIPTPFSVVRYHSLIATDLSDELEAIAWNEDGLLMGLRHRTLPIWGVQFHPESICSEYGRELLTNFFNLTVSHKKQEQNLNKIEENHPIQHSNFQIHVRKIKKFPDAQFSYEKLFANSKYAFWLDSSKVEEGLSRFSYLGSGDGPYSEYITYQIKDGKVAVQRYGKRTEYYNQPFYDYLDEQLKLRSIPTPEGLPFDFNLGYVGYLGYELKAETCGDKFHESEIPDASLLFVDRMLVLDHLKKEAYLLCLYTNDESETINWLDATEKRLNQLPDAQSSHLESTVLTEESYENNDIKWRHDKKSYLKLINQCLEEIRNGESYEICLTNTATLNVPINPLDTYKHLRTISPVPYGAFLNFPNLAVLSASPERFVSIGTDKLVESKPIKGTRKRGMTPTEDEKLRQELLNEEKDRSENLMIVDLVRNDLNTVCEVGSVHVPHLFHVETYAPVHQLISTIRGTIRSDKSTIDCVRAAFPGGSMTGAPKIRTMKIIDKLEGGARGIYSGGIGWFSLSGASDISIVIRTIVATKKKTTFGVGGAIISLSDPIEEYEETQVKARAMLTAISKTIPVSLGGYR
ncbi:aminodeoxychorismate synthase component I [Bacillus cereus]|uniref:aminodeoxychorismate synthase n=1 Tax=Bacillus cereus TaxID=1396 RepID=A0A9W7Q2N0_BACCE|nr:aminodeoxychorismate synthase component I [Bacillus cereus]KAA6459466.1 aminodeoxychorismate synthase component I [Bacillus cereus]KAB2502436.1 aminodeoxychorismate synthase component I [Bacillus cereus]